MTGLLVFALQLLAAPVQQCLFVNRQAHEGAAGKLCQPASWRAATAVTTGMPASTKAAISWTKPPPAASSWPAA
jgi:hypothetical protein